MAVELGLELILMDRAHEPLELAMSRQEDRRGGHLIDVAHLQADDPILDLIEDPHAMASADLGRAFEQLHELQALAVQADGTPRSNSISRTSALSGARSGGVTSWKTSSSGAWSRSSIQRPSEERPQRLSSIE